MSALEGELTRHHSQPFYAQQSRPQFFWAGCLGPLFVILLMGALIIRGALSSTGLEVIRSVVLTIVGLAALQLVFGGSLFWRQRSSLGKGLMIGAIVLLLSVIFIFIALASLIGNAIH